MQSSVLETVCADLSPRVTKTGSKLVHWDFLPVLHLFEMCVRTHTHVETPANESQQLLFCLRSCIVLLWRLGKNDLIGYFNIYL